MGKLGKNQLDQLASISGVFSAVIVPDKLLKSLCARGMMAPLSERGSFIAMTPAGYRAVADALESGAIVRPPLKRWNAPPPSAKAPTDAVRWTRTAEQSITER